MNDRIRRLAEYVKTHDINPECREIELDPFDDKLAEPIRNAKRLADYMLAQEIALHDDSELIGLIRFDKCPVPGDIFHRTGHAKFREACDRYYGKPQENLCTFEWQHSNPDLAKVVHGGLEQHLREINAARLNYLGTPDRLEFLTALEMTVHAIARRTEQYRAYCLELAETVPSPERRAALMRMAANLGQVPMRPARTFEEAIQSIYICWMFLPDSIGRPDQYLLELYRKGIADGSLTRDHAKELLQEFFIAIHRHTKISPWADDKGGESHFVIGGYTADGEDGYNELSELILESMMETPLVRPQVSLRWNRKTPFAVLKHVMECERHDKLKRIAYDNDEPRIRSMREILGFDWRDAYDYIMVGCNEPAFQGGISLGGNTTNILRSLTDTLTERRSEVLACKTFDEFYRVWERVLFRDLAIALDYSNRFNMLRSRDCNVLSSLFLAGCIERAQSATRGGARLARSGMHFMGGTNLIDSLTVIEQFVFDEKRVAMRDLLAALDADWKGAEKLRAEILRDAHFFGNNDPGSNAMARRVHRSCYDFAFGRREHFGNRIAFGNLTGYNPHFAWFGALTGATPDGRVAGSTLTFGSGQVYGKEHEGLTSHLLSVAQMDPTGIMCGDTIMNITVEADVLQNDEAFDKFVRLVEAYFKAGGLHLQNNFVSREELLAAKAKPQDYKSLRVRVSGFSATFVDLHPALQDNVIDRTTQKV